MEKESDILKGIGKRMPYIVPDDFFTKMDENVIDLLSEQGTVKSEKNVAATSKKPKKSRIIKMVIHAVLYAAAVALFFVVRATLPTGDPILASANDFEYVELAFNNLSTDDQGFLIQVYEDDYLLFNP